MSSSPQGAEHESWRGPADRADGEGPGFVGPRPPAKAHAPRVSSRRESPRAVLAALTLACAPLDEHEDYMHPLPEGAPICGRPDYDELFPHSLRSSALRVHYYLDHERDTAAEVLALVEHGWRYHVGTLGPQVLRFAADGTRTLAVTVVPTGAYDPDRRGDRRYPLRLLGLDAGE